MTNTPTDTSVQKLHKSPADTSLHKTQRSPDDSKLHKTQIAPDDELVEAVQTAIDEWFAGDMTFRQQLIGQFVAQSILPLLASREAAVLERASLLRGPSKHRPDHCYCKDTCMAPVVMGKQTLCIRDASLPAGRTLSKGETP